MSDRVRIWVPTDEVYDGERLRVHAPGADGTVDYAAYVAGGARVVRGHRRGGWGYQGPAGHGVGGREARAVSVRSGVMGFGRREFAVRLYDRKGDTDATPPATVAIYVNAAPRPAGALRSDAALSGGRLRFTFTASEDF